MTSPRTPKSPISFPSTAKVHSNKSNKIMASTSSKNITNKALHKTIIEDPTLQQQQQNKNQENLKKSIIDQQIFKNTSSFFISCQINQETQNEDSIESLKQKVEQLSSFLSRQTELINSFEANLDQVEMITKKRTSNSSLPQNSDPFLNIKYRFQFLIDDYINQKKDQHQNPTEINQRAYDVDKLIQEKLGSNYTTLQFQEIFQEKHSKSDTIFQEKMIVEEQLQKVEKKLQELTAVANEDKQISEKVKSFYLNRKIDSNLSQRIEKDIDLSVKVRCIFDNSENDEAILNTIQSNKESASDNETIFNLSKNLQQLGQASLNLSKKHQDELSEKDNLIDQKAKEIEYLKGQLETIKQRLFEKDKEISKLKEEAQASKNEEEIKEMMQKYEAKLNELQANLLNKENLFDEVKYKLTEQQKLNDQKEIENTKLRVFVDSVKTILKINKSTI